MNEELNSALRKIEELEARLEMTQAKCSALASENEMLRLENKTLVEKRVRRASLSSLPRQMPAARRKYIIPAAYSPSWITPWNIACSRNSCISKKSSRATTASPSSPTLRTASPSPKSSPRPV